MGRGKKKGEKSASFRPPHGSGLITVGGVAFHLGEGVQHIPGEQAFHRGEDCSTEAEEAQVRTGVEEVQQRTGVEEVQKHIGVEEQTGVV